MENRIALLVVDDDDALRTQLRWQLSDRFEVTEAADRDSAVRALEQRRYPVVLLDLHLTPAGNDRGGVEVLRHVARTAPHTRVVLLTGESDPRYARESLRWGAWDYCSKPMDPERLRWILERAARLTGIESSGEPEETALESFGTWRTANPEMAQVLRAARELAATRLPVLILGKEGSGRTTLAREILSARLGENAPLVVLAPGALPGREDLSGGAGFILEEVEELSREGQARLESLLDPPASAESDAVGRILATAREDPLRLARTRRFLPGLARRLETARLAIPPLARRTEDHGPLTRALLAAWSRERDRAVPRLTPEAEQVLTSLLQRLEAGGLAALLFSAADRAGDGWIGADLLTVRSSRSAAGLRARRAQFESAVVREALDRNQGNVSRAARELGVSRPTMHDLLRKYELDPSRYR